MCIMDVIKSVTVTVEYLFIIKQDFHWVASVMPQGWDFGVLGGQKFNFLNMVMWHIKLRG